MEINFADDSIKELTEERKEVIKEYIDLQPKYSELAKWGISRHIMIRYLNEELDIDRLSEEQCKRLDQCKDSETREHITKDFHKTNVPYNLFYITPYNIGDEINKQDVTVDSLDTYVIKVQWKNQD